MEPHVPSPPYTHVTQFVTAQSPRCERQSSTCRQRPLCDMVEMWHQLFSGMREEFGAIATTTAAAATVRGTTVALSCQDEYRFVIFLTSPSMACMECMLGCLGAGCVLVPLNTRWSLEEMVEVVGMLVGGLVGVVVDSGFADLGSRLIRTLRDVGRRVSFVNLREGTCCGRFEPSTTSSILRKAPKDVACIVYTSGTSSSKPKAAMLTHDNIIFQCGQKQACCGYHGKDVYLHVAPWYHVGGLVSALAMVMVGARHEFLDARQGFDAGEVLDVMQRKTCTSFIAVPTMLRDLVSCWEHKGGGKVLLSVKRVLVGAGGLGQGDAARVKRMLPRAAVLTAYGMTEACSSMSYMDIGNSSEDKGGDPFHSDDVVGENAYVGKVPRGIRMGVLSHQGTVLDEGRGELLTSGRHVFSMYYSPGSQRRQPEHFVLDFRDGTVWFRTGDMGYVRGDQLWLSGRLKDIIKTGGENVHAAEVERVLGSLGGVMECSVFAVPDIRWGEAVAAALVIDNREEGWTELMRGRDRVLVMGSMASSSTTNEAVEYERIKAYCRERGLAPFKVPKVILVMDGQKSALPKNATGKVIKRGVQDMVLALLARVETPQRLANHPVQNQHKTWQYRAKL